MFDEYRAWKKATKNSYEKRRTLQFHAVSALGSALIGMAAVTIAYLQYGAEIDREREQQLKESKARERAEIKQASELMTSVD